MSTREIPAHLAVTNFHDLLVRYGAAVYLRVIGQEDDARKMLSAIGAQFINPATSGRSGLYAKWLDLLNHYATHRWDQAPEIDCCEDVDHTNARAGDDTRRSGGDNHYHLTTNVTHANKRAAS